MEVVQPGGGGSGNITPGVTLILSGVNTRVLYDNNGVVGEYPITGTGGVVAMQTSPNHLTSILGNTTSILTFPSAATWQLGDTDAAAPVAQILSTQSVATGTTNTVGTSLTIKGSRGTGTGLGGSLILQTAAAGTTGSTQNPLTTQLTIDGNGLFTGPNTWSFNTPASYRLQINTVQKFLFGTGDWRVSGDNMLGWTSGTSVGTADVWIGRRAAATIQLGLADAAAPIAQTLTVQGSRAGTDSNIGGANLTIQSGNGTGTSTPSTLLLKSPVAVVSGTGAQTQTTGLTINVGTAVLTNYIVANLPSAATAGAGALAFVTDGSATLILGLGLTVAGGGTNKVPVYSDGTNWIVG